MSELLKNLNEQQLPVAKKFEGKFIVNAGAGSGKTSTIVTRTAYMIEQGINPGSILMFTFTRKAAMEMKERMIAKIGPQAKAVTICTYHAFSSMLLRRFAHLVGYDKNFTIADSEDTEKIIKDFCGKNSKLYDIAKTQIPDWKTHGITVDVARNNKTIQNDHFTVFLVYEKYQQKLRNDNMMDFGDLANYGLELISKYSEVQEYVWNKYVYITAKLVGHYIRKGVVKISLELLETHNA
jgi:ATP-dependent DNA helicase, uvrD/REP family